MKIYKPNAESYLKYVILLFLPIISIFLIFKFSPNNDKLAYKATLISASFESPEYILSQLKERFSDLLTKEKDLPEKKIENNIPLAEENIKEETTVAEDIVPSLDISEQEKPSEEIQEFVPEEYRGPIIEEQFKGGPMPLYISANPGYIMNKTKLNSYSLLDKLTPIATPAITIDESPLVLLFSTHATESFEPCDRNFYDKRNNSRSTDNEKNITKVIDKIAEQLIANGIPTIVDKTQHDFPSYNGSYKRSAQTIAKYMNQYPSIKFVLDIHRDAMERSNGERVKAATMIDDKKTAQIMIISGCDDGEMNFPNWLHNFKFACDLQTTLESKHPGLTKPLLFCYRKYNMDCCKYSLLIEFGSNSNCLSEALNAGEFFGNALSDLIRSYANINLQ